MRRLISFWLFLVLCVLQGISVNARPNMKSPKKIKAPVKIRKLVKGKIAETRTVDFDGDKKADYIISVEDKTEGELGEKFWINSKLEIVKTQSWNYIETDFLWFIDLDGDSIPEIISASGFEDGIDYSIYKQNFNGQEDTLLLVFNPVIIDGSRGKKTYWGYPWDISDVLVKSNGGKFELFCSFNHKIVTGGDDGDNSNVPEWQKRVPVILFSGRTTQPQMTVAEIETRKWLNIREIIQEAQN